MYPLAKTDISSDPRMVECLQLVRGFAETMFDYVERVTGKQFDSLAHDATAQIESVLRRRIESLIDEQVTRAFDRIIAEHPQGGTVTYTLRHPQRTRHLLRLLSCSFSGLVATQDDGLRHFYPKILFNGIEEWASKILGEDLFQNVNLKALEALGQVAGEETDDDQVIWSRLTTETKFLRYYYTLMVPLLMPFRHDFDGARGEMQRQVSLATDGIVALTAVQWNVLFYRLFGPLFRGLSDHDVRGGIDEAFSIGTALQIAKIYASYRRWLKANQLAEPNEDDVNSFVS